jgi:SAM-dependent methyltransferase
MVVCPGCCAELSASLACHGCGWQGQYRDSVPILLRESELCDDIMRCYTNNYDQIARDDLDAKVMDERYIENLASNFCKAIDAVTGAEVCDVGSGKGYLARKLLARGAKTVTAVDISFPYLSRMVGEPGISPVLANAEALPFVDHFDVIVATDVLEHVLNIGSFLYCVNRALRAGGRLFVRVPFRENLLSYSPHFGCPYRFVHLRTFDRPLLRQALEEAGFAVMRLWHDGYMAGMARPLWRRGRLRSMLYRWFDHGLSGNGRNPSDATLRQHRLPRLFLQPTVVIAATKRVKCLVPQTGGGFGFA